MNDMLDYRKLGALPKMTEYRIKVRSVHLNDNPKPIE